MSLSKSTKLERGRAQVYSKAKHQVSESSGSRLLKFRVPGLAPDLRKQCLRPGLGVSWRCSQPLKFKGLHTSLSAHSMGPLGFDLALLPPLLFQVLQPLLESMEVGVLLVPLLGRVESTNSPYPIKHPSLPGRALGPLGSQPRKYLGRCRLVGGAMCEIYGSPWHLHGLPGVTVKLNIKLKLPTQPKGFQEMPLSLQGHPSSPGFV